MRSPVCVFLSLAFVVCSSNATEILPGQWEYTMSMSMPGVPFQMPEVKTSICVEPGETQYGIPYSAENKGDCSFKNLKQSGNTISYDMVCGDASHTSGHFQYTFTANTIEGEALIKTADTEMTQKWKGRRTGDCK